MLHSSRYLFDRIAGSYDRLNHLFSLNIDRWWRRCAVRTMTPADHVLDVAIGTGDLTLAMLRAKKAQRVTGIDLSQEMMAIGQRKVQRAGWGRCVKFELGNALQMPYDNESFDAVTCGYGVRNFSDLDKGLSEMYRVLKPGGELIILEFSYPSNPLVRWCYDLYFSHLMPWVGRLLSRDETAYTYFRDSVKHFIWGEKFSEHLKDAHFTDIRYRSLTFGISMLYVAKKPLAD